MWAWWGLVMIGFGQIVRIYGRDDLFRWEGLIYRDQDPDSFSASGRRSESHWSASDNWMVH